MEILTVTEARRLALARAGLMKPEWTGFPIRVKGRGKRARDAAAAVIIIRKLTRLHSSPSIYLCQCVYLLIFGTVNLKGIRQMDFLFLCRIQNAAISKTMQVSLIVLCATSIKSFQLNCP